MFSKNRVFGVVLVLMAIYAVFFFARSINLATARSWKDKKTNEPVSITEWHSISIWEKNAINYAKQYLKKGSQVYVEGKLETNKWQDQSGQDRYTVEVVANEMQLIGGSGSGGAAGGSNQFAASSPQETKAAPAANKEAPVAAAVEEDDEIPF